MPVVITNRCQECLYFQTVPCMIKGSQFISHSHAEASWCITTDRLSNLREHGLQVCCIKFSCTFGDRNIAVICKQTFLPGVLEIIYQSVYLGNVPHFFKHSTAFPVVAPVPIGPKYVAAIKVRISERNYLHRLLFLWSLYCVKPSSVKKNASSFFFFVL